jgi:hypothetical protein
MQKHTDYIHVRCPLIANLIYIRKSAMGKTSRMIEMMKVSGIHDYMMLVHPAALYLTKLQFFYLFHTCFNKGKERDKEMGKFLKEIERLSKNV